MPRKVLSALALMAALSMVAAACSKPRKLSAGKLPSGDVPQVDAPVGVDNATTESTVAQAQSAATKAGQKAIAKGVISGTATTINGVSNKQAEAVGALLHPQSTARVKPYYPGVGEDTINLDFSYDATSCGVNVVNAITAAGGALPTTSRYYRAAPSTQAQVISDTKEGVAQMVQFWNDHAFDVAGYLPHIRPLLGNDAHNQFFGRHLNYKLIDGGSNQCPDKTRAAA